MNFRGLPTKSEKYEFSETVNLSLSWMTFWEFLRCILWKLFPFVVFWPISSLSSHDECSSYDQPRHNFRPPSPLTPPHTHTLYVTPPLRLCEDLLLPLELSSYAPRVFYR
jgi:hypothetical protein